MTGGAALLRWPGASPRMAFRMMLRNVILYRRSWRRSIFFRLFEPLLYLVSLGLGLGPYIGRQIVGVDIVLFIAPGLVAVTAMNGVIFDVTFHLFAKVRFARLYDAVITTPLEPEDCALGELLWAVFRSLIYGIPVLAIMSALGFVRSPWLQRLRSASSLLAWRSQSLG